MSEVSLNKVQRIAGKISNLPQRGFKWISGLALMAVIFLVNIDVVSRTFFNKPVSGSYELSQLLIAVTAAFSFAYAQVYRSHIDIPVLTERLPKKAQAVLQCVTWLLGSILFAAVTWKSMEFGLYKLSEHEVTLTLGIPVGPFYFIMAGGCALFAIVLAANFIEALPEVKK